MYNNMSMKLELYTETCVTADSAAAVETLRAEVARAKQQAWMSNLAANKATDELKTEQSARRQCDERISFMERELEKTTV